MSCKCGSVAVDGGNDYCRLIGEAEDIIIVNDDGTETPLTEVYKKNENNSLTKP